MVLMFILSTSHAKKISYHNFWSQQTKVFGNVKPLKTGNTENVGDNTKEDDSENSKEKLSDISNTDKRTYG